MENQISIDWLTAEQVMAKINFGRTALYKMIKEDGFPRPVKVGQKSRWVKSHVEDWMRQVQDAA